MKTENAVTAIAAADEQLARAGLPTYSQLINQAQQLSAHAQTVQKLTEGGMQGTVKNTVKGANKASMLMFSATDC